MGIFAGIDVHSKQCVFVLQDEAGQTISQGHFDTTADAITTWAKAHKLDHDTSRIGMESGSVSPFVANLLIALGFKDVRVIDAQEVRKKARKKRQKSDFRDAFDICDGVRRDIYVCMSWLPDAHTQALRDTLSQRRHFVRLCTREINAVKGLVRRAGLRHLYRSLSSERTFARLKAMPQLSDALRAQIDLHHQVWSLANKQVLALDAKLKDLAKASGETAARLQSVPGVGPIVALTALAYFGDAKRFESAKKAASYTGLVPQTYNSADRESYGHITKTGPGELRTMLVEAAHHAAKKHHPLHGYFCRLKAKKGYKSALIAVAHKLARILWAMMKNETTFDEARHGTPQKRGKRQRSAEWEALCV